MCYTEFPKNFMSNKVSEQRNISYKFAYLKVLSKLRELNGRNSNRAHAEQLGGDLCLVVARLQPVIDAQAWHELGRV